MTAMESDHVLITTVKTDKSMVSFPFVTAARWIFLVRSTTNMIYRMKNDGIMTTMKSMARS